MSHPAFDRPTESKTERASDSLISKIAADVYRPGQNSFRFDAQKSEPSGLSPATLKDGSILFNARPSSSPENIANSKNSHSKVTADFRSHQNPFAPAHPDQPTHSSASDTVGHAKNAYDDYALLSLKMDAAFKSNSVADTYSDSHRETGDSEANDKPWIKSPDITRHVEIDGKVKTETAVSGKTFTMQIPTAPTKINSDGSQETPEQPMQVKWISSLYNPGDKTRVTDYELSDGAKYQVNFGSDGNVTKAGKLPQRLQP